MKLTKLTLIFIFLLAFAVSGSAQDEKPKITWGNFQERYEKYSEVEPTIKNVSDSSIYMFDDITTGVVYDFLELYHSSPNSDKWFKVIDHGHPISQKQERKDMSVFELESDKSHPLLIDDESWVFLTESSIGFGLIDSPYNGKGRYKFYLQFYTKENKKLIKHVSESPKFEITKEQKSFFDK